MTFFYTGKGDTGQSNVGGKNIDKTSAEIEAVGSVDELNSLLGVIRNQTNEQSYQKILKEVQEHLFTVQAHIGSYMMESAPPEFPHSIIENMERIIDNYEQQVHPERGFIVSGETELGAWLDYARAVARRTEIQMIKFYRKAQSEGISLESNIMAYVNRLSSLLYAMARHAAQSEGKSEKHPDYS